HWWPLRGESFSNSALLMPYSRSSARLGLTHVPRPIPVNREVLVVRLLSGMSAPMRGARYQLPSCAFATLAPPSPRAISANKVVRFLGISSAWFFFGRPLHPRGTHVHRQPAAKNRVYVNYMLARGNASRASLTKPKFHLQPGAFRTQSVF